MIKEAIARYKRLRTGRFLSETFNGKYAFVGMGQHSLDNLYPVLDYLKVPLKYICVTSEEKAEQITRKFPGVQGVASIEKILSDPEVAGVLVAAAPSAHYQIASKVLGAGKSLFIEKPPCSNLEELEVLASSCEAAGDAEGSTGVPVFAAGLQKRYAPAVRMLKARLGRHRPSHYDLHYRTGAYPEGNALLDLFIHPLDMVTAIFGEAKVVSCTRPEAEGASTNGGTETLLLTLEHPQGVVGTLELSTAYSWKSASESMSVCTAKGEYRLEGMDELSFRPFQGKVLGIPLEKVRPRAERVEYLYRRNGFNPVIADNQIVSAGYFDELRAFTAAVEAGPATPASRSGRPDARSRAKAHPVLSGFDDIRPTYRLLDKIAVALK